jgi:hypothetical protein
VLTIGDEHGGAGEACMDLIAAGLDRARTRSLSLDEAARQLVGETMATSAGYPVSDIACIRKSTRGLGDFRPRRGWRTAGDGIRFARASKRRSRNASNRFRSTSTARWPRSFTTSGSRQGRQRCCSSSPRRGLSAEVLEELTREKTDAHQDSGHLRRRAAAPERILTMQWRRTRTNDHRRGAAIADALLVRARAAMQASTATTRPQSIGCAVRSPGRAERGHRHRLARMSVDESGMGSPEPKRRAKVLGILRDALRQKSIGIIEELPKRDRQIREAGRRHRVADSVTSPYVTPIGIAIYAIKCRTPSFSRRIPAAGRRTNETVRVMRAALAQAGAPEDLLQCVERRAFRSRTS